MIMPEKPTDAELFNKDFLEMRCRIIDIAAALDRCHFGEKTNTLETDPRFKSIVAAIEALIDGQPDRAARVQMVFSDDYTENWRQDRSV
jgi:hypothetical protein